MKSSIVICAYTMSRWAELVAAVDSCRQQTESPAEIIVVVDYNEELQERARREFLDAIVIPNHLTKGLSGARNSGVLVSKGDVLVFLDDDAYAEPTWLERLTKPFEDPRVAGTGGWIVPHWEEGEPRWFPSTFLWVLGCSYSGLPGNGASVRNPIGASMAMRRSVFAQVGGYTSGIGRVGITPLGCEETELCIRYIQHQPLDRFVLVRDAIVHHRVPASRATAKYFLHRCWAEGLSKAAVSTLVGTDRGLSAERDHIVKAVPREMITSLAEIPRNPIGSLHRMALILAGSLFAVLGLVRGSVAIRRRPVKIQPVRLDSDQVTDVGTLDEYGEGGDSAVHRGESESHVLSDSWLPIAMVQIDVDGPIDELSVPGAHDKAWVEAVRRGQVIGRTELVLDHGTLSIEDQMDFFATLDGIEPSVEEVKDSQLPRATVVVPTICRFPSQLVGMVEQLLALDYPDFDIIIVDNRTAPNSPLPELPGGNRIRIVSEAVPGISAARNRGVMLATGDIVAFTDDDVLVDRGWLRAMGRRFALNPDVVAIGGLVLPAVISTQPQLWFEEFFGGFCQSFELNIVNARDQKDDPLFPYAPGRFGAGCNMAFRRDALTEFGGFRLSLGTGTPARGGEDLEIFITMALAGKTLAFEPAALVRHTHRQTEDEFLKQVFGYGAGLTAMYMSLILAHPHHLLAMLRRAPQGLKSFRESRVERAASRTITYPSDVVWIERRGMMYGPIAFIKSLRKYRNLRSSDIPELDGVHRF